MLYGTQLTTAACLVIAVSPNHYNDMKGDEKCKKWGGMGIRGTPRSTTT